MKQRIPVITYRKDLSIANISLCFPGGSSLEDEETLGFAHFCEHLAFKLRYDGMGIADYVEGLGGSSNAFTSNDGIVFDVTVRKDCVAQTLRFLEQIFAQSFETISDADFNEEKKVVLEEKAMYEDDPMENVFEGLMRNLFPSHPYGHRIVGEERTLEPATKSRIAEFWHERVFARPFLVVSGGFDGEPSFEIDVAGEKPAPELSEWTAESRFLLEHRQKKLYFSAAWRLPAQSGWTDAYLRMIFAIIYGIDGSRIYNSLVYEDAVFDEYNVTTVSQLRASIFVQTAVMPAKNVLKRIQKWVTIWNDYEFTQAEVAKARETLLSNEYFNSEGIGNRPEIMEKSFLIYGDKDRLDRDYYYEFLHITADDLNEFKRKYLGFDTMVFGVSKPESYRFDINAITLPKSDSVKPKEELFELKKRGVRGFARPLGDSAFITGYILKKSGAFMNWRRLPGSFKFFLDVLCCSAKGMTRDETESFLDKFGISVSPVSGNNVGGIKFKVRDSFIDEAAEIIGKIFENEINDDDFRQEKQYALSHLSLLSEEPSYHISKAVYRELFAGTPYEGLPSGTYESIEKVTPEIVRAIRRNFMRHGAFSVAVSGNADSGTLSKIVNAIPVEGVQKPVGSEYVLPGLEEKTIKIPVKGKNQLYLTRAFRGPSLYDSDYDSIRLLENYLIGEKSPLFIELREKQGLVYTMDVSGMAGTFGGSITFSAITSPQKCDDVVAAFEHVINDLKNGKIYKNRLDEIKNTIETGFFASQVKSNYHSYNMALDDALSLGKGLYLRQLEIIRSITAEKLAETAARWLQNGIWVMAGDVSE